MSATSMHFGQRRLLWQTAVSWVAVFSEIATGFLLAPLLIRHIGAEKYGVWVVFNSTFALFALVDFGLRGTLHRAVALADGSDVRSVVAVIMRFLLIAATVATIGHLLVGVLFPYVFPKAPHIDTAELIAALGILSLGLHASFLLSFYTAYLAAAGRIHESTAVAATVTIVRIPAIYLLLQRTDSLVALAAMTTAIAWCGTIVLHWRARDLVDVRSVLLGRVDWGRMRDVRSHGSFSFAARTSATVYAELPTYAAMILLGPSAVALLAFCFLLVSFSRRLVEAFSANVYPLIMRACARQDSQTLRDLFNSYLLYNSVLASLLYFGIFFFGGDFLRIWLAPATFDYDTALRALALGSLFIGLGGFTPNVLEGFGRYWRNMSLFAVELVLHAALLVLLVRILQLREVGVALAFVLPRVFSTVVFLRWLAPAMQISTRRLLGMLARNVAWWGAAVAVVGTLHRLLPPKDWPTLIMSCGVAAACFLSLVLLRFRAQLARLRSNAS